MNRNNLSWVDNKVFSNPGAAPTPYQPSPASPTAVSPATYQDMAAKAPSGVSPATYQDMAPKAPAPAAVSPATYQNMSSGNPNTGVSPAQYQAMPNMSNMPNMSGVSPATYQKDPVVYPVQTGMPQPGSGMPGAGLAGAGLLSAATPDTLTRDESYAPSPFSVQGPPTVFSPGYTPAYLKSQIGKTVRAEFAIGGNLYTDRTGILRDVGVSYLVLEDLISRTMVMCDLYSLKFLTSL